MGKYTCAECVTDGGFHYDEDGRQSRCPNYLATKNHEAALKLTSAQNADALKAALAIVRDFAETRAEFCGNDCREAMQAAHVPSGTVGAAFSISASGDNPIIAATGRFVQSTEASTRHRIGVWRSLIHSSAAAAGFVTGRKAG